MQNRKAFIFNFFIQKLGGPAKQESFHIYFFTHKLGGPLTIASEPVGASVSVVVLFRFNTFFEVPLKALTAANSHFSGSSLQVFVFK